MKRLLPIFLVIITAACSSEQIVAKQLADKIKAENDAANYASTMVDEECGVAPEHFKKGEAVKRAKCKNEIYAKYVTPSVLFPDLLTEMQVAFLRNADAFDKGKISEVELEARRQEAIAKYIKDRFQRAMGFVQMAKHDDEVRHQQIAAFNQSMQQIQQQQELINAINRPKITTCHAIGDMISCNQF